MGTGRYVDFNRDVLTRSHIRMIDVLGTVLFAQLPFAGDECHQYVARHESDESDGCECSNRRTDEATGLYNGYDFVFCGIAFLDFDSCMDVQCSQGVLQFERLEVVDCCACRNNRRRYCKSDFDRIDVLDNR